jgi:methionyl-tRNA synthetase
MLSFAYKRFDGVVPEPGDLDAEDKALLSQVEAGFETVGDLHNACKFRAAPSALLRAGLGEALALAREANGYLDRDHSCEATAKLTRSVSPGSRSRRTRLRRRRRCT